MIRRSSLSYVVVNCSSLGLLLDRSKCYAEEKKGKLHSAGCHTLTSHPGLTEDASVYGHIVSGNPPGVNACALERITGRAWLTECRTYSRRTGCPFQKSKTKESCCDDQLTIQQIPHETKPSVLPRLSSNVASRWKTQWKASCCDFLCFLCNKIGDSRSRA